MSDLKALAVATDETAALVVTIELHRRRMSFIVWLILICIMVQNIFQSVQIMFLRDRVTAVEMVERPCEVPHLELNDDK